MGQNMVPVQITPYEHTDFSECARLMSFCVGNDARQELREYLNNPSVRVFCARGDRLYGVILLLLSPDCCDILDIAVDTPVRRKGVAGALVRHAEDVCRKSGIGSMMLEVRLSNTAAREFYKSYGFIEISQRKNYYSSPTETAAVMKKEI